MQSFLLVSWSRAMLHTLSVTAPTSKKAKTTKWFGTWGHLGDSSKRSKPSFRSIGQIFSATRKTIIAMLPPQD